MKSSGAMPTSLSSPLSKALAETMATGAPLRPWRAQAADRLPAVDAGHRQVHRGSRRAAGRRRSRSSASWPLAAVRSSKPSGASRLHQQVAVDLLVVDHQDAAARAVVAACAAARGSARRRTAALHLGQEQAHAEQRCPAPGVLCTVISPPIRSVSILAIVRPRPAPAADVLPAGRAAREGLEDALQLLGAPCRGRCPRSRTRAISRA